MFEAAQPFVVGLSARHDDAAQRLQRVFADRPAGFAPADLIARIEDAFATEGGPRSYAPADPSANPTEGWNPLDPTVTDAPFIDPIEEARREGYDEGFAAAQAAHDAASRRDLDLLEGVLAALKSDDRIDRDRIAAQLRQTVLHLVTRLVGEVGISADLLAGRVEAAAELLADASESAILRVASADVALLEGRLPASIFAVADPALARGTFVLEAASTIVEDGPALWLEQLTHALDKVAVPSAA
ncbi:flagellar biosynthesis protein FliH [Sphingomonas sp. NBWT7]|uniref:FliH/SctL family protein n=1 Tax=Sphingomonas sp. NBWT7 TaxID=2596913 RepID=UPI0016248E46|nr:flagellar biosynthesis protein FliH [Sphingomonas sp. NBWT7]QNE32818.1 flagellar biosynthesis protein FliH [Sphingomonas sp. NBWT7]